MVYEQKYTYLGFTLLLHRCCLFLFFIIVFSVTFWVWLFSSCFLCILIFYDVNKMVLTFTILTLMLTCLLMTTRTYKAFSFHFQCVVDIKERPNVYSCRKLPAIEDCCVARNFSLGTAQSTATCRPMNKTITFENAVTLSKLDKSLLFKVRWQQRLVFLAVQQGKCLSH